MLRVREGDRSPIPASRRETGLLQRLLHEEKGYAVKSERLLSKVI